jgi:hypothetical protein
MQLLNANLHVTARMSVFGGSAARNAVFGAVRALQRRRWGKVAVFLPQPTAEVALYWTELKETPDQTQMEVKGCTFSDFRFWLCW